MLQDAWTENSSRLVAGCVVVAVMAVMGLFFLHSLRGPSGRARVSARAVGERQARLSARAVSSVGHRRLLQGAGFKLEATEAEH